jgi:hypothetical protein
MENTPHRPVTGDMSGQFLRLVELNFERGNPEGAHAAVDAAFRAAAANYQVTIVTPLGDIMTPSFAGILDSMGIVTVSDLLQTTPEELMRIGQIGAVSCAHAQSILQRHGFDWG